MSKPIYEDPTLDGAADPVVINRRGTEEWWMFYTNRRAAHPGPGVEWVHGSPIGVAVSADAGATWQFRGNVAGLDDPADPGLNTHWAPEIVWELGEYHMYLSYITGTPDRWPGFPRRIVHFTSPDLGHWTRHGVVPLASDYVIDAAVALCPDGLYRLWYKDEANGSCTGVATSRDLCAWWWMIVDEWRGQAVFRSADALGWERQGIILDAPGRDPGDAQVARHADVVVQDGWAALFYFTHPNTDTDHTADMSTAHARRSVIHWARLTVEDEMLRCERDVEGLRLEVTG